MYDNGLISTFEKNLLYKINNSKIIVEILKENSLFSGSQYEEKIKNILINEDCLSHLKKLPDNIFDHCITDPPYNISNYEKKRNWLV